MQMNDDGDDAFDDDEVAVLFNRHLCAKSAACAESSDYQIARGAVHREGLYSSR